MLQFKSLELDISYVESQSESWMAFRFHSETEQPIILQKGINAYTRA